MSELGEVLRRLDKLTSEVANSTARQNQLETIHERTMHELQAKLDASQRLVRDKAIVESTRGQSEVYSPTVGPYGGQGTSADKSPVVTQGNSNSSSGLQSSLLANPGSSRLINSQIPVLSSYSYMSTPQIYASNPVRNPYPSYSTSVSNPVMQTSGNYMLNSAPQYSNCHIPNFPIAGMNPIHPQYFQPPTPAVHQYTPQQSNHPLTRLSKVEFPRFNGKDFKSWWYKAEQFFSIDEVPNHQKVSIASIHLDDIAIQWHQAYMKSRQHLPPPSWEEYLYALSDRFGAMYEDPMKELVNLKQTGSVAEFQEAFDRVMTRLNIAPEHAISIFMARLKPELEDAVRVHMPYSLPQAYHLARIEESIFNKQTRAIKNSLFPASSANHRASFRGPAAFPQTGLKTGDKYRRRHLSSAELSDKRAKGLCYVCDEKYQPGHVCKNQQQQLFVLELAEENCEYEENEVEENQDDLFETCEISLEALNGFQGYHTLRVTGYNQQKELNILIDSGATHNFIDCELVAQMGWPVEECKPYSVRVADGNVVQVSKWCKGLEWLLQGSVFQADFLLLPLGTSDMVLGIQWLCTLGDIKLNFNHLTMEFDFQGRRHKLQGNRPQMKTVHAGALHKVSGNNAQLFMVKVLNAEEVPRVQEEEIPAVIKQVLEEHQAVFAEPRQLPPSRGIYDHQIPLQEGAKAVNARPYRYSPMQKDVIEKLVQELLAQGLIQHSNSPFASPVVLVGKKDGSWRMCIDYRALNQLTIKDKYPLPIIEELLDELGGSQVYSKIDLRSGYHQIRMTPTDIHKTAFKTHSGHYEYLVMPFGLTNAPSSFQSLMNKVFEEHLRKFILVFFDDILVFSRTLEEHVQHLHITFQLLSQHHLFARRSKCQFAAKELEYLGHYISSQGVATDPKKIQAVQEWPTPHNVKQLRGFLGLAGYYRRFIRGYGQISKPLTELLKKDGFKWSERATVAFQQLKNALTSAPVLALPDFTVPFVIETDACDVGIGAVLMQRGQPIAYMSKGLSSQHQAMSVYDKELLALVMAVTKWGSYVMGKQFIVKTDQKALKFLLEQKLHTGSQLKWITKLMQYDFIIEYKQGKENKAADALSRLPAIELAALTLTSVRTNLLQAIVDSWQLDSTLTDIIQKLQQQEEVKGYTFINQQLRRYGKLVVGPDRILQQEILATWHDSTSGGHSGMEHTHRRIAALFYWKRLKTDVVEFVKKCAVCQKNKYDSAAYPGLLQPLNIPSTAWSSISMDFIEGLPKSQGKTVIWVIVDRLTKYAHFLAISHPYSAEDIARMFMDHIYKLHGMPEDIVSDRDPIFTSKLWQELFAIQGVTLSTSTAYHPQSDGQTEVINRCLETYLRCYCSDSPTDWVKYLSSAEWWYNTSFHSSTQTTPYEALYGQPPPLHLPYLAGESDMVEVDRSLVTREFKLQLLKFHLARSQQRMVDQANKHRSDRQFKVGDWVFLKIQPYRQLTMSTHHFTKLSSKYFGPYQILQKIGQFKTFSERIEDVDIDVYRSLDPLKAEPSEGSSFFRDCLIEWRELNTAEDFISFYEEIFPLVQTLPQIILQKELIVTKLLSKLDMKGRLSLEPILRLIAALSRDLLEDFKPFLQRIADSLVYLLKSGADREPDIIEQVFKSWSLIMMYLQKYLIKDVVSVLRVTVKLRYYPKEYVQEFMADSVSFLLRNASVEQLIKGVRKLMFEVAKKPLEIRKSAVSSLLWYIVRGSSSRLHSKAEQVLRLLIDKSLFDIGDQFTGGAETILEVLVLALQRLCAELEAEELKLMWACLYEEITECVTQGHLLHLSRLLSLLVSTLQISYIQKLPDYQPMLQLIQLLVQTYILPYPTVKSIDQVSSIVDEVMKSMLCILDGLYRANNISALSSVSMQWAPVFDLRNKSLLSLIGDLLLKDPCIVNFFRTNIISALNDMIEVSEEEVIHLLRIFVERLPVQGHCFLDEVPKEKLSRIHNFLHEAISRWVRRIQKEPYSTRIEENELAILWGIIGCYPSMVGGTANESLLMELVNSLDELSSTESADIAGHPRVTWQSLIGAALGSYCKLLAHQNSVCDDSIVSRFLYLARKHKTCSQVLSPVADILDSVCGSTIQADASPKEYHPELVASKMVDALDVFAVNLSHYDKKLRLSTLRILCHYEPLADVNSTNEQSSEKKMRMDNHQTTLVDYHGSNVIHLLLLIEEMPLSIATSRKVILLISKIQMSLSTGRIAEEYIPVALGGIIGIFHNRFSPLWNPTLDCIAALLSQYFGLLWDRYIEYLGHCLSVFMADHDKTGQSEGGSSDIDLIGSFRSYICPVSDSTPCAAILSLLIQCLQKIPSVAESRSRQIVPLFLKFLGYNIEDLASVELYDRECCRGKEWKGILQEWLSLFRLMRNPRSFYLNQFFKEVLLYRLLEEDDADLQVKVLDCLLNWKDDFLISYDQHLKNLINAKSLREELTTWSLSRESDLVDTRHRVFLVPVVIRILAPKVRKLKVLSSRKHASVHHRKAILGFLAQLDVEELPLFFALLIKPLVSASQGAAAKSAGLRTIPETLKHGFDPLSVLEHFRDCMNTISWKKRYGFLHVIEDIVAVFDEVHIGPFLDLLMGCIVRLLESCTSTLESTRNDGVPADHGRPVEDQIMTNIAAKQSKDLRSLCLKIISFILSKYEDHEFSSEFWDLFFKSVQPLVASFKQEGASSEKPSSLFSCFLAMSRSSKLVHLLTREKNLVPDIFSMLAVSTASDAIVSSVLKFVENILDLEIELGNEDNPIRRLLLPHVDVLVCSLHRLFVHDGAPRRKLVKYPGEKELNVFKLLSKHIKEPMAARKFLDILLPLLSKRSNDPEICVGTLQIIKRIVEPLSSESSKKIVKSVSPLVISAGLDVRTSICDVLDAVAANDSSVHPVAKLLRELNATSTVELGDLDYDTIIAAYEKISADFFHAVPEEHALIILSHAIHDMSSEDLILRQSAYRLLLSFVEFSSQVLDRQLKSKQESSETWVRHVLSNVFLKHMGTAMNKEDTIQKVWIDLLRDMVLKLPPMEDFKSFAVLYSEDPEQDFFNNIVHLQRHRRARALLRFKNAISSGNLSKVLINKVFIPLLFKMLLDGQVGKGENVRSACLEAIASISRCMEWRLYYALLNRCFREMTLKPDKQKVLLRLISSILDQFHFSETPSGHVTEDSMQEDIQSTCLIESGKVTDSSSLTEIQMCLQKDMLPRVQKMLAADSDNVNVNISLILLKLLKLFPGDIMELQLPSILHRIANFLKNRLESVREEARTALAACLKELGLEYLQFVVKVLRGTLRRGFELHVLGFTLNFLLSKFLLNPSSGRLDYCLEDLLSIAVNDILSNVSEEKEVEKIASKMKETRKQKSYDTLKLIAQSITFKTHALKLLAPIIENLKKQLTPKVKTKLENMLSHIAAGVQCNPSVNQSELFIFSYGLIRDGIRDESPGHAENATPMENKQKKDGVSSQMVTSDKLVSIDSRYSHLITEFALGLLQNYMKNMKFEKKDEQLLSMLDPFVRLFGECLNSKYENVMSASLRCLSPLVRLPLPSLESQAEKIKNSLLNIAQGSVNSSNPLMDSCVKLLTVLLRSTKITLSTDQLHMLIQFPLFVDLERNPSFMALSLLKAIVSRKLVVAEIYDIVKLVAELMVTSQVESIRKKCSQILLQFLLDYHISEKRLQQHLDFLLSNLRYEHSTGREAVLEMLHAIIMKFPVSIIDEQSQTVFLHLVVCLANDRDNKVRSMTGTVIKLLIGRVSPHSLQSILEYSRSWYLGDKEHLRSAAAQVLGLLIEVMKDGFQKYIDSLLPVLRKILQSAVNVLTNKQVDLPDDAMIPSWKEAYYSLVLFEKILNQFPNLCFRKELEDLWVAICELLLHPHLWLRNISNRLVACYFATVTEACRGNLEPPQGTYFLMRPSRLFFTATSLCCQLKVLQTDDAASDLITQNLVFSICALHSFLGRNEFKDHDNFWSTIEHDEQGLLLKAFQQLDSRKGKSIYLSLVSDLSSQEDENQRYLVVSYLLKTMGKISLQVEDMQMKIIFNCFKSISPKLIDQHRLFSAEGEVDNQSYAYHMLLPLYKVCEGYAGKVISDDVKQLAEEVRGSISKVIGVQNFVQIYSHIRKNLKSKRDKRKQEEKVIAVVNPMRNAKRKLRVAEKHKAHKKRKMMAMKMGRWM